MFGEHGQEKAASSDFMNTSGYSSVGVVNVEFEDDVMSVQLAPTSTISSLKGVLYEQTFLPPSMQNLYACIHGAPAELSDNESLSMLPTMRPLSLVMPGETPRCA
jgi:hypothetical protein